MHGDDGRSDTWEALEDLIAARAEKKLAAEMLDPAIAALRAREFAGDAVRLICATLGGGEVYVPKLARHHREQRDTQLRLNFNGALRETAREVQLSVRQVRNIVSVKK
jgi:Mor family transcriptional regulator